MHLFRFEHRSARVATRHIFFWRVLKSIGAALVLTGAFVMAGAVAYKCLLRPDGNFWDAIHRASMIVSGMGPVDKEASHAWEWFLVDLFALVSTLVLTIAIGIILAPIFHRVLHHWHISDDEDEPAKRAPIRPHKKSVKG
jgi:hypothetical protein